MAEDHKIIPSIITVVGDSLALPRQLQQVEFHHTYPYLLAQWLRDQGPPAEVWGSSNAGSTISQLMKRYDEYRTYVGQHPKGIGVVHLGVVDCSPRPIPSWLRRAIGKLPRLLRSPIIKFLHNYRVQLLRYGPGFLLTSHRKFRQTYRQLLDQMRQDFGRVYAVNIIPPGTHFESRSPGVGRKIVEYNAIIAEVVEAAGDIELVDIWSICQEPEALETYVSEHDGHHLSIDGHQRIFEMLVGGRTAGELLHEGLAVQTA